MKQAVIFDFDGTIADSFDYVFNFIWSEAHPHDPVPAEDAREAFRDMSMKAMARKAGISTWKLIPLYFKGRRVMRANMPKIEPFKGIPEQIILLHGKGYELHIVSSNSRRNIRRFLRDKDLHQYFVSVQAGANLFGKRRLFRKALHHGGIRPEDAWGVGDQRRDASEAHYLGMKTLGVTWGFDDTPSLERHADVVVEYPAGITEVILSER
jgi:phosphoglycolate phosphatase